MEQFITPAELRLISANYSGEKVISMLKSIRKVAIMRKMNLARQNSVSELNNCYSIHKSLDTVQFKKLYRLWFNFVLMDYSDVE